MDVVMDVWWRIRELRERQANYIKITISHENKNIENIRHKGGNVFFQGVYANSDNERKIKFR